MLTNWKTSAAGLASSFASFVMFSHELHLVVWPKWALALGLFASIGGLAGLGIVAKDYHADSADR